MFEYSKEMRIKLETMCTDGSLGSANVVAALPKVILGKKNKAVYTPPQSRTGGQERKTEM